jgi:membrane-associated protein
METLIKFVSNHAENAHWIIFLCLILAGLNIPISIDLVLIISAIIAATIIPENTYIMFFFVTLGCIISAWICYSLGRFLGDSLKKLPVISTLLKEEKVKKLESFYAKYGIWTFVLGRFIPFGVRNCIFLTSGISKMPFAVFALRDGIACLLWCGISFTTFYALGQNIETLWSAVKQFNIVIFSCFSVTVISVIWYKLKKKK